MLRPMTTTAATLPPPAQARASPPNARRMLNKVPEITLWFWLIKIMCTTVGETAADYLNVNLGFGLTNTTIVTGVVTAVVLAVQFRLRRYVPGVYWLAVVMISVFGTLITDNLSDTYGVSLLLTTPVFAVVLAAVFAGWYASERTLSIHSIVTTRREAWYWLTILFTFALGTAAGDLISERASLGYLLSIGVFAAAIAVVVVARFGFKAGAVLTFWVAYVLTRPLGASIGDYLSATKADGGVGLGTTALSYVFLAAILGLVGFLTVSRADRTPSELVEADAPPRAD